jgi:hypothetical protein
MVSGPLFVKMSNFRELLAENPIDYRIFFADNPQRKTESGIGGKNS